MKKFLLFATVSLFAVSTMLAQDTAPQQKEKKPKTEAVHHTKKHVEKKEVMKKESVKKVPAKNAKKAEEKKAEE